MRLHILFLFKQSPWGGANQFLHALRDQLREQDSYCDNPDNTDALIVNLNPGNLLPALKQTSKIKLRQPDKIIIVRIDGPISLIRDRDDRLDHLLFKFIKLFADGVIYQSHWSKIENNKIVQTKAPYETVIHNAADPIIFHVDADTKRVARREDQARGTLSTKCDCGRRAGRAPAATGPATKYRLIATSWSPNMRKGFAIYQYLDKHLDFSRYSMTFVGNSPLAFKNIERVKPVSSSRLAHFLRQHDIYLTASQNDPCSNALIEAISCGLPPVALAGGGHPELVQHGGELFTSQEDIRQKINLVAQNLAYYRANLPKFSITKVAHQYLSFAQQIHQDVRQNAYQPKHINLLTRIQATKIKVNVWYEK